MVNGIVKIFKVIMLCLVHTLLCMPCIKCWTYIYLIYEQITGQTSGLSHNLISLSSSPGVYLDKCISSCRGLSPLYFLCFNYKIFNNIIFDG